MRSYDHQPASFNLILKSNTHRFDYLIIMIVILVVAGALIPLIVPIPFFITAAYQIILEPFRIWRTLRHRDDDAASLTVTVRGIFPGAPDITPAHLAKLVKTGRLTIDGEDGSCLRLVLSDLVRMKGMRDCFAVRASLCQADYGLGEFDRIMGQLAHSGPVAVALSRINAEERNESAILTPVGMPYPEKPKKPEVGKPSFFQPDDHKSDERKEKNKEKATQRALKAAARP